MSIALSNGASVVAFIGLSLDTLKGLHLLHDFIESVRDAPQDLRCLFVQLKFFQLSFSTFRESIAEATRLGIAGPIDAQARLALEDAENTILDFRSVTDKYGEGRATSLRKRIRVAVRKNQLGSLAHRLAKVSEQVQATHSGIALMASVHQHHLLASNTTDIHEQFTLLKKDVIDQTSTIISEKFDLVNHALNDATRSIIHLIGDLSSKTSLPCHLGRISTGLPLQSNLIGNIRDGRNGIGELEATPDVSSHLSAAIRAAVSEVLPQMLHNITDGSISQPHLESVLRRILLEHDVAIGNRINGPSGGQSIFRAYPHIRGSTWQQACQTIRLALHEMALLWIDYSRIPESVLMRALRYPYSIRHFKLRRRLSRLFEGFMLLHHQSTFLGTKSCQTRDILVQAKDQTLSDTLSVTPSESVFIICRDTGRNRRCLQLPLSSLKTNEQFFVALRRLYHSQKSWTSRVFPLHMVDKIRYVKFDLASNLSTDHCI